MAVIRTDSVTAMSPQTYEFIEYVQKVRECRDFSELKTLVKPSFEAAMLPTIETELRVVGHLVANRSASGISTVVVDLKTREFRVVEEALQDRADSILHLFNIDSSRLGTWCDATRQLHIEPSEEAMELLRLFRPSIKDAGSADCAPNCSGVVGALSELWSSFLAYTINQM